MPKRAEKNCLSDTSSRSPRVGSKFQVDIPDFDPKGFSSKDEESKTGHRQCVWQYGKLSDSVVESYLRFGKRLFENGLLDEEDFPAEFCEARGLYFLHKCDYDVHLAMDLLTPLPAGAEEDIVSDDESDENCWICNEGGDVLICDYAECSFVYHTTCLGMEEVPDGEWHCPRHVCLTCKKDLGRNGVHVCEACACAYCSNCAPPSLLGHPEFFCQKCSVESNRTKELFYKRLKQVHTKSHKRTLRIPHIHGHEVDLHKLYRLVISKGGLQQLLSKPQWLEIVKHFDFGVEASRVSARLLDCYKEILLDYERRFFKPATGLKEN